ncbi:hypothetical protein BGW37DRAFT_485590 [Umbelopsis sp. PMI_123]|nr:hypothetical protein BGW37DRAFT_485590 [Umbelopsis sp. PMI_123]
MPMQKVVVMLVVFTSAMVSLLLLYATRSPRSTFSSTESEMAAMDNLLQQPLEDALPACTSNTATRDNITLSKKAWEQCLEGGSEPSAYLSIVIVTRMDDYAGNQFHRFQNFINSAYLLAEHTKENIELLIIEWNPPESTRRVYDVLRFRRSKYLNYRIIAVPKALHNVIPNVGNAPLHEFEGKNLGIRFARGEYIVCTNQDDIWSINFHNAIKSHFFRKGVIYLQHQDRHNIHDDLPPSIVRLPVYPDDDTLYNACVPKPQDWGNFKADDPIEVNLDNILQVADQAGDFTLAHRDTWRFARGYRETGGVAWVDIEFVCTAAWTLDLQVQYITDTFACHQDHPNIWEQTPERHTNNSNIDMGEIMRKEKVYLNDNDKWGMQEIDIWQYGLDCHQFNGGLCW